MSYVPYSEPSATFTATNYVVYTKKIGLVSGTNWPIFTTENGLGNFCVTDIYVHCEPSTPTWNTMAAWRISLGFNVDADPGKSYNNIANETGPHNGDSYVWAQVPILGAPSANNVDGAGTTVNSNTTVYARTLQMSDASTTNSGTVIVGGFYSRVNSL